MPAKFVHVPNIDRQIVTRLPLDVERGVHRIGEFIGSIVYAQVEGYLTVLKSRSIGRNNIRRIPQGGGPSVIPHGFERVDVHVWKVPGTLSGQN